MDHQRLEELGHQVLDHRYEGIPPGIRVPLADLGKQGWNVARGDLTLPVTALREDALEHNIATMASYCAREGVLLAPHGKTTMAPQLFERQMAAGAWGLTAATASQAAIMRDFGVPRIMLANELLDAAALRWAAREMEADPAFEFCCLVDDPAAVTLMDEALHGTSAARKLPVLVEAGPSGGRAGVRSADEALAVATAAAASRHLALAGLETYEGPAARGPAGDDVTGIDELLDWVHGLVVTLARRGLFTTGEITVSGGGSLYFDRVVARLRGWDDITEPVRVILRSGCYISHDAAVYHRLSPLDGRRSPGEPLQLRDALEAWSMALSRPEPGLVILGCGKRDVPYDIDLPIPLHGYRRDGTVVGLDGHASVSKVNDQHAFMTIDPDVSLAPGDIVRLGLSHPCTAFDKVRLVPFTDADHNVTGGVLTFF